MKSTECPTRVKRVEKTERLLIVSRDMGKVFAPLTVKVFFRNGKFVIEEGERKPIEFASEVSRDLLAFFGCVPKSILSDLQWLQGISV